MWQSWLNKHWQCRLAGDLASVRNGLGELELRLGIDTTSTNDVTLERLLSEACSVSQAADVVLLRVSLLRRDVGTAAACQMADHIGEWLKAKRSPGTFQYHLQRGLNELSLANRTRALDEFLAARTLALSPMEHLFAGINLVLALEDLGFDYEADLERLRPFVRQSLDESWLGSIIAEHDALLARTAYRRADIQKLSDLCQTGIRGDQASYFLAWATDLPFFRDLPAAATARNQALAYLVGRHRDGYLVGYELRTLQGIASADDDTPAVRPTERIERLYAWCWHWLVAPGPQELSRLLQTKDAFFQRPTGVLTADDYLQLECALRWLALFAGIEDTALSTFTRDLSYPSGRSVPVLDYEKLFLDWLVARRTHDDVKTGELADALRRHPLGRPNTGFDLSRLVCSCLDGTSLPAHDQPWGKLRASIANILEPLPDIQDGLIVDVFTCEIHRRHPDEDEIIRGHSLARLMALGARAESFPAAEAMQVAFGIPRYEEHRHEQRLAKLLVQANKCGRPWIRFTRRGTRVFVDGDRHQIRLYRSNAHVASWMAHDDPAQVLLQKPISTTVEAPAKPSRPLLGGEWRTRSEIQSLIGCSKTIAVQRLREWENQGKLERKGEGKATRYRLLGDLANEIIASRKS